MKTFRLFSAVVWLAFVLASSVGAALGEGVSQPGAWQTGPFPPSDFQYARHDGVFVPGPALEPWANKVYFPGGRTSPSTESPNIWMFDPLTGAYTDTGADVVEDVSNYNANLILDDGTGRGPAIYIIGGTDKDHGGINIGMVQRYYPRTNECEALPTADNWNGMVGGYRVAAMGTAVVDDVIYVYGGWETSAAPYFSGETWAFDPRQPSGARWTNLGVSLHTPRSYIMSAVQDGKVYAIGGVGFYDGSELDPVDTFEVLDTANPGAGWTLLAPMPTPGGEGRAFGFDADTLGLDSPYQGKLYVVAANDWPGVSGEVLEYDVATNTWRDDLPELPTPRADLAGVFVPLCTSDPNDGLPGLWTFGGRINESCYPPLGPTEFAPMVCQGSCTPLTGVNVHGPAALRVGETGVYTASIAPEEASAPVYLAWDNGATTPATSYAWDLPGIYTVALTATNCEASAVATDTQLVVVSDEPVAGLEAFNDSPTALGAATTFTAVITAGTNVSFAWDFGDGALGNGAVVTHVYAVPGLYTATVTASNSANSQQAMTQARVAIPIEGLRALNDSPTPLGEATLFTAVITAGSEVGFAWNFGDGAFGEGALIAHTYAAPGLYTAVVTASNSLGAARAATPVRVLDEPVAGLRALNDSPTPLGEATLFTAVITAGTNVSFVWNFGDGAFGEGAVVTHTYAAPGLYTATVTATNTANTLSATTQVRVVVPIQRVLLPMALKHPLQALGAPEPKLPKADWRR